MSKLQLGAKRPALHPPKSKSLLLTALVSVLLSFLLAILVMASTGVNPLSFFKALLQTMTGLDFSKWGSADFFRPRYVGEFLQISMPLILSGCAMGFANRTGMFNIGGEGQLIAGMLGANLAAILLPIPGPLHAVVCVLAAMLFGALWGLFPGLLKAYFGVHEVVTTIMFNYVAFYLSNWALRALPGSNPQRTVDLPKNALLGSDSLRELTGNSRFHWGFIVVILAVFLFNFIINRTSFGYELRAVGYNRHAAEYAGINAKSRIVLSMVIAGAFAGLAGSMLALGTFTYGRVLMGFENFGFDGIAVALLGGSTGYGIVLSGLLLGGLKSGQSLMQTMRVPLEIAQIVSALVILFVAMQYGLELIARKVKRRRIESVYANKPAVTLPTLPQVPTPPETKEEGEK